MSQIVAAPVADENAIERKIAALREAALNAVAAEDIAHVMRALLRKACEGCVQAAKLVLGYTLGKPAPRAQREELTTMPVPGPIAAAPATDGDAAPCPPASGDAGGPSPNASIGALSSLATTAPDAPSLRGFFADLGLVPPLGPPKLRPDSERRKR